MLSPTALINFLTDCKSGQERGNTRKMLPVRTFAKCKKSVTEDWTPPSLYGIFVKLFEKFLIFYWKNVISCGIVYDKPQGMFGATPWCNGSTTGFGPVSLGSSPGGVANFFIRKSLSRTYLYGIQCLPDEWSR